MSLHAQGQYADGTLLNRPTAASRCLSRTAASILQVYNIVEELGIYLET